MSARNTEYSKQQLARQGYVLSNLWHVQDVLQIYEELTVVEAEEVLENALNNEGVMESIFEQIDYEVALIKKTNKMKDNKLIAEFMGYPDLGNEGDFSYLKYDTSWDWLMPVVGKIRRDEKFLDNDYRENLLDVVPYGRIEDVFDEVVLFINQYNKTI